MGLDIYLIWDGQTDEDRTAQYRADLETYASLGYLRSSYNSGGFNSWARRHLDGRDLYHIFGVTEYGEGPGWRTEADEDGDESKNFYPDWQAARERAESCVALAEQVPPIYYVEVSAPMDVQPDLEAVQRVFNGHQARHNDDRFGWYSNREGWFFLKEPPKVLAVIHREERGLFGSSSAAPVLVCQGDETTHDYYRRYTRAVVDFIDQAVKRPNPRLYWSG